MLWDGRFSGNYIFNNFNFSTHFILTPRKYYFQTHLFEKNFLNFSFFLDVSWNNHRRANQSQRMESL